MAKKGIAGRVWSPVGHILGASGNTVKELANTAGNLTKRTVNGARRVGNIWTNAVNGSIRNVVTRGGSRKGNLQRVIRKLSKTRRRKH